MAVPSASAGPAPRPSPSGAPSYSPELGKMRGEEDRGEDERREGERLRGESARARRAAASGGREMIRVRVRWEDGRRRALYSPPPQRSDRPPTGRSNGRGGRGAPGRTGRRRAKWAEAVPPRAGPLAGPGPC